MLVWFDQAFPYWFYTVFNSDYRGVKSLTSEGTPSAIQFFKQLYEIIHPPFDYKLFRMLCLALRPRRKVQKLDFQSEFSMSKIIPIFLNFFFIEE